MAKSDASYSPTEMAKLLKGLEFPAEKEGIIEQAQSNDADEDALDLLEQMEDREYTTMADVQKGLGEIG